MSYKNLYPTESAYGKKSTEDGLVYCKKCGFPCRTKPLISRNNSGTSRPADMRMPIGSTAGKGVVYSQQTIAGTTVWVPEVVGGCPNCGTYLWDVDSPAPEKGPTDQKGVQKDYRGPNDI